MDIDSKKLEIENAQNIDSENKILLNKKLKIDLEKELKAEIIKARESTAKVILFLTFLAIICFMAGKEYSASGLLFLAISIGMIFIYRHRKKKILEKFNQGN